MRVYAFGADRYRVIAPLGAGAFAEVLEVEDTRLGVRRALKVLRPEAAADPTARARFAAEARTMASLAHPHLVAVTDVGEDIDPDGVARAWLVMELLPGGTLAEAIARTGAGDPVEACRSMLGVIEGVALAHSRGVIHRDIKPANLLLDGEGRLKLGDFGIAQLRSLDDLTRTGVALGSWAFMAPEQRLDPRRVGPASDVYGLAATLTWWIHGGPVSDLHVAEHRARLLARAPEAIAGVLARALAFRADERFRSAVGFGGALGEALGEGEGAPPEVAGAVDRPPAFVQRAPSAVGSTSSQRPSGVGAAGWAVATGVVALLAGAAAGVWVALRDDVRGVLVEEPEEVRRARAWAAMAECASPQGWEHSVSPRREADADGLREASPTPLTVDLDGDGHVDQFYVHNASEQTRVFWGSAAHDLTAISHSPSGRGRGLPAASDIDNDGRLDVMFRSATALRWMRQLPDRTFAAGSEIEEAESIQAFSLGDLDRDQRTDILLHFSDGQLLMRRGLGGGEFASYTDLGINAHASVLGDVDGDDGADLVTLQDGQVFVRVVQPNGRLGGPKVIGTTPLATVEGMFVHRGASSSWLAIGGLLEPGTDHRAPFHVMVIPLGPSATGSSPCRLRSVFPLLGSVADVNDDDLPDVLASDTCSYCTSEYNMWLSR